MTKTQKMSAFLTVILVITILATIAEIVSCMKHRTAIAWLPIGASFPALAIAFSSLDEKKKSAVAK